MSKLTYLSLSNNKLTNTIPTAFSALSLLKYFNLHSNLLSGSIPATIATTSLTSLDVSSNFFTGTLPSSLCGITMLQHLAVNSNIKLGCYPSCLSNILSFFHGAVTVCTSSSSSDSPVLSTSYIAIIVVLGSVFLCSLIFYIIVKKRRAVVISDSKLASKSLLAITLIERDGNVLDQPLPHQNSPLLFHGTLQLKSLEVTQPVDVILNSASDKFKSKYELHFQLHQLNSECFTQPFGYAKHGIIDFTGIVFNTLEHIPKKSAGIVIEKSTDVISNYLNIELVEEELRYYRQGKVATSIIKIVATAATKDIMLSDLNLNQLRVYENGSIKLAIIGMTSLIGKKIEKEESNYDSFYPYSYARPNTGKSVVNAEKIDLSKDIVSIPLLAWKLGLLLLELFADNLPSMNSNNDLSFDMINFMSQDEIISMIDRVCPDARNYLRRQLLQSLLQKDPEKRPILNQADFQAKLYLEDNQENVLFFFLRINVPFSIVASLLEEHPKYVGLKNLEGPLPLQYALEVNADPLLVDHLLTMYPESCLSRFPDKDFSLTDYALAHNMSDDHMRVLLPYFMPIDNDGKERASEAHDFGWVKVLQHLDPPDKYIDTVFLMLSKYSDHIKQLAYCMDELGRTALNIATPKCKEEIIKILYFLGIYDLSSEIAHQSHTCIVRLGIDTQKNIKVALNFMKHKDQFDREISVRAKANFSEEYVLGFLTSMDSDIDENFRVELLKKGYTEFKYVLVMIEAERTLHEIIAHEHIAGKDWDKIRGLCTQLTQAVKHVHSTGLIHGDIKPLNVMRVRGRLVLIDLDASVSFEEGQYAGAKYSSAYMPPEMLYLHESGDASITGSGVFPVVRSYVVDELLHPVTDGLPFKLLPAQPSYDMWSLGVTLFHLCSGTPLFRSDNDDSIKAKTMKDLYHWTDNYLTELLSIVSDPLARNLLSQLFNKNPERQPSADRVLAHPFLSGKVAARLPGELPEFDVFVSYRVASDAHHVEKLYKALLIKEIRVWWDKVCLEDGKPWNEGFCNGLAKSMAFIPILSREAINSDIVPNRQNFSQLSAKSPCDDVFLEHRLALEMRSMGLIELIYPVMIGDKAKGVYSHYFAISCHPKTESITVHSVEEKVIEHLDRQGLGAPLGATTNVSGVLGELLKNPGGFVVGGENVAFDNVIDKIVDMVNHARETKNKRPVNVTGENQQPYQSEIEALKQKIKELTEQLKIKE